MNPAFTAVQVGWFGKLPGRGDFVRGSANPAQMRELDDWLSQAMDLMSANARWQPAYDTVAPLHFAFVCPRRRQAIGGHLVASRDQSGRRYPFLMAGVMELAAPDTFMPNSPLVLTRLWRRLEALAATVHDAADPAAPLQAAAAQAIALDLRTAAYDAAFEDFLEQQTLGALDALLAQSGHTNGARRVMLALGLLLQPVLAGGSGRLEKSLVLPLPEDPLHRHPVAAFWLHLVAPFLARTDIEPILFIARLGASPALVVGFNGLSAQTLRAILDPAAGLERHITFDQLDWLEPQVGADPAMQRLSASLARGDVSLRFALESMGKAFIGPR
ncbi:type VI secretion system-associated protein TagF [Rugamonas sp. FT82W]|uniref:Type VI secretion system-associated protein TagF n=2 Tax=Duganella vulcania TaxID=2692166 RepID=A0A845GCS1_9BURK|nr:type VI secretion system-associated protein TagF [Duganella vulcania]